LKDPNITKDCRKCREKLEVIQHATGAFRALAQSIPPIVTIKQPALSIEIRLSDVDYQGDTNAIL